MKIEEENIEKQKKLQINIITGEEELKSPFQIKRKFIFHTKNKT
jgi:hypothetical protein